MTTTLRQRLAAGPTLAMPGVFDALSAHLAARAGFEGVFLSGSAMAYTQLARPDFGLVTLSELAATLERIVDRINVPVLVDADSGFGNALNVARTVRLFERAGAAAIQIEDQINHKPPADLTARPLVSTQEMVGKIKAALDARHSADTLISARSDSPFTENIEQSLARAHAYAEAGADIVFIEGLSDIAHIQRLTKELRGRVPLLHNVLDGGRSPLQSIDQVAAEGFAIVLFPGAAVQAAAFAMDHALKTLKADGRTAALRDKTYDPKTINQIIETPDTIAQMKAYDAGQR